MATNARVQDDESRQLIRARNLSTVAAVLLCAGEGASLNFGFLVEPGMEHFHISAAQFLLWYSINTIAAAVTFPITGWLIKRFGVRLMVLLGGLIVTGAFLGMALATQVIWLYILSAAVGVGWTCTNGLSANTLITGWQPEHRRGTITGIAYSALGLAGVAYGALYPLIMSAGGYVGGMLGLATLITVMVVLNAIFFIKDPPAVKETLPQPASADASTLARSSGAGGHSPAFVAAIALLAIGGLGMGLEATYVAVLPATYVSFGVDPTTAGLFLSLGSAAGMLATPLTGWICDRWGIYTALAVGAFGYVVGDAGAALLVPSIHWLGFIFTPISLCFGSFSMSLVVLPRAVDRTGGVARFPVVHSIALAALFVGLALGAVLWGEISDATGSFRYGLYLGAATGLLGVAGCACAVMVARKERRGAAASAEMSVLGL